MMRRCGGSIGRRVLSWRGRVVPRRPAWRRNVPCQSSVILRGRCRRGASVGQRRGRLRHRPRRVRGRRLSPQAVGGALGCNRATRGVVGSDPLS
eukprot:2247006-Pyramimonas_sp.AAC.1